MDYVRYLDKVKKEPLTLQEGFKYEMINRGVADAIPAKHFLLRLADLLPGKVHPGVKEIHDKAEHAFYILQGTGKIRIDDHDYELRPTPRCMFHQAHHIYWKIRVKIYSDG